MTTATREYTVRLLRPHAKQALFIDTDCKRTVIRGGRRGGKTVGIGTKAVQKFLQGRRVLYGAPTSEQMARFWMTCKNALAEPIDAGVYYKNETEHIIELPGTETRIRAKTCWNADTLRGDYADFLILDEFQLMHEDTWDLVGAPMLLDNNGDAVFIYTPPSLRTAFTSKAKDPRHAAKLFKKAAADTTGRWRAIHFSSYDNPFISAEALSNLTQDMTLFAIRQEIEALDLDDAPGALWTRDELRQHRLDRAPSNLVRVVVAIDPPAESTAKGSGAGIMVGGIDTMGHGYLLADCSAPNVTPAQWGQLAIDAYRRWAADRIVGEVNNGGEMIEHVLRSIDPTVSYEAVHASRGKAVRAEPIAARYEKGFIHHVGEFAELEDELCIWTPADQSPHRLDAAVWLFTELMLATYDEPSIVVYSDPVRISTY